MKYNAASGGVCAGGNVADEKTYEQQVKEGEKFVRETLAGLAAELGQPDVEGLEIERLPGKDFDNELVSIYDPKKRRVVSKLRRNDLADSPATPSVKRRLKSQVESDVRSYYTPSHV